MVTRREVVKLTGEEKELAIALPARIQTEIEANEKLAQSTNAKIIVVGTSRQGEPLIIQP